MWLRYIVKQNGDTQTLEDTASLVFIENYILSFSEKHPEYDEDKWIDIIRKTWRKMIETHGGTAVRTFEI